MKQFRVKIESQNTIHAGQNTKYSNIRVETQKLTVQYKYTMNYKFCL